MDLKEFGIIIRDIREQLLDISQNEMASELNSTQALLSRLENGKGSTPQMVFAILELLNKKGINAHLIFHKPFDFSKLQNLPHQKNLQHKEKFRFAESFADKYYFFKI